MLSFLVQLHQELYYEEQSCIRNQCDQELIAAWACMGLYMINCKMCVLYLISVTF